MLEYVTIFTTAAVVLLNVLSVYVYRVHSSQHAVVRPKRSENVLVVTAHPDDECMFFAPTIIQLHHQNSPVSILCLSNGNFRDEGAVREKELYASCRVLGIAASNVTVLNDSALPDNPDVDWPVDHVAALIQNHVDMHNIGAIITFDEGGVSGHANHIACYKAVKHLVQDKQLPDGVVTMVLETTGLFRKYMGVLDCFASSLCPHVCISDMGEMLSAQKAMREHTSQMVWFRWLYIFFSRYMCHVEKARGGLGSLLREVATQIFPSTPA